MEAMNETTSLQNRPTKKRCLPSIDAWLRPIAVRMLARYDDPRDVQKFLVEKQKRPVPIESVRWYSQSPAYAEIFNKERQKFLNDLSVIPAAQKSVRLTRAEELYREAKEKDNNKECRELLYYMKSEMDEVKGGINLTMNQYNILSDKEIGEKIRRIKSRIVQMTKEDKADVSNGTVS